jgi:hypothetical protein
MLPRAAPWLLALAPAIGCTTTATTSPAGIGRAVVIEAEPVRAWKLVAADEELGAVVQYETADGAGRYFSVRNRAQQELGTIDAQGRAWRFVPHEREALWVATGTLADGARSILSASAAAALVEVPIEALAAGN